MVIFMEKVIEKLQNSLNDDEAAIIKSDANRFYLTGFSSSDGIVLLTRKSAYFLIDFRYFEKAKREVKNFEVLLLTKTISQINDICKTQGIKTVFTECDKITLGEFSLYKKSFLADISSDNKIGEMLELLRSVKSAREIENIKKAQEITDKTFSYILEKIKSGKTEKEIALQMEFYLRGLGSEGISFDFIVVSGKNSSLPHGVPTDKKIENGDFVTMDFGAVIGGYRSDMTRTVAVGFVTDEQRKVYDTVLKAQEIAFENIKPDVICKDVDFCARDFINKSGYEGCFGHGLGHSVGIEIHENPSFNTRCETALKSGMVLTVEPGIYLENKFGVRIEDMVIINDNSFENITKSSKELLIL
ncbi:MAG: aminopeptidase P family protein [Clostridia bacterium]|nr:aminopeptidase P family protein [Clostridia bacterium]